MSSTLKWLSRLATCSPQLVPCSAFVKSKRWLDKILKRCVVTMPPTRLVASVKAALRTIWPTLNFDASSGVRLMSLAKSCNPGSISFISCSSCCISVILLLLSYHNARSSVSFSYGWRFTTADLIVPSAFFFVCGSDSPINSTLIPSFLANTITDVPDSDT